MHTELVRTKTEDGLTLDGALFLPGEGSSLPAVDAFILLHGVGGSFYGGSMFQALAAPLLALGSAVLRVNTRGHGAVSMLASDGGPTRGGAAFEIVDQCRYDINAWVEFLVESGFRRVGLLGHSLGALKAVYSATHDPPSNVVCVIAASSPRLSCSAFQNGPSSAEFFDSLSTANQFIKDGRPGELFTAKFPVPLLISAASFIDKYGDERYNMERLVSSLDLPALFTYGGLELERGGVAFAGLPEAIARACNNSYITVKTIPAADHFYTGAYDQLVKAIVDWLQNDV